MSISFDLESYKAIFSGGARQYHFYAQFNIPNSADSLPTYLVRSSIIPESSLEEITIDYPGHSFKMAAGRRTWGDWTISFTVDVDSDILGLFNGWHDLIYDPTTRISSEPRVYMRDQLLYLLDGNLEIIKEYKMVNAWPKTVNQVPLDYSSTDLATVDVVFSYQYYITKKISNANENKVLIG